MKKWRLPLIICLGVVLIAAALVYRHFWTARPVGDGPAGPAVDRQSFAQVWTDRQVLLLGLGDSITAGFGVTEEYSYFGRLVKNPDDEFPEMQGVCLSAVLPNLRVRNESVSGSTSLDHLRHIESLPTHESDVLGLIVITTGGNDLIHNYGRTPPREGAMYGATLQQARPWIEAFEKRLHRMIDLLEDRFPGGCHLFLADVYDPTDGVGDAENAGLPAWPDGLEIHGAYNDVIHRCARQRPSVHLVPIHAEFLGHGIHCTQSWREHYRADDPHYWYYTNLEDPNARGYDAIRRLFLNEIAKLADKLAAKPNAEPVYVANWPSLKVGLSKEEVIALLGKPVGKKLPGEAGTRRCGNATC